MPGASPSWHTECTCRWTPDTWADYDSSGDKSPFTLIDLWSTDTLIKESVLFGYSHLDQSCERSNPFRL